MSAAFLALWNGVRPERRAEYEQWHSIEHMPERLGAAGFRAAHRYRDESGPDYFTLYELDGLEALETPAYEALMHQPTDWSARMRPALTGFRRLPCRAVFDQRRGRGGALATLHLAAEAATVLPALRPMLEAALRKGSALGILVGDAAEGGKAHPVFPDAPVGGLESLVLLEGSEAAPVAALARDCAALLPGIGASIRHWRLLQSLRRDELPDPALPRQSARPDLLRGWTDA